MWGQGTEWWLALTRAAARAGTLGAFEAAEVALRVLHALVQGQASADPSGRPLLPLPRVRRELASPACLPHLAQARPQPCAATIWGSAACS